MLCVATGTSNRSEVSISLMRTTYAALLLLPGAASPFSLLLLSIRCLIFYVAAVGALAILFLLIRHRINNGGGDDRLDLGPRQAQSYAQAAAAVPMLAGERAMLVPFLSSAALMSARCQSCGVGFLPCLTFGLR